MRLAGDSQVCHRRWFAEWFEERHGVEVPELSAPVEPNQLQMPF